MNLEKQVSRLSGEKQSRRKRGGLRMPLNLLRLKNEFFDARDDGDRELAEALCHELMARLRCIQLLQRAAHRLDIGTANAESMVDVLEHALKAARRAPRAPRVERDYSEEVATLLRNRIVKPYAPPMSLRAAFDVLIENKCSRTDVIGRVFGITRRRASAYVSMARKRARLAK